MPTPKKGDTVRQRITPAQGVITSKVFDEDRDCFRFRVAYTGPDGEPLVTWFSEADVELVAEGAAE